jgi:hypothetical protein
MVRWVAMGPSNIETWKQQWAVFWSAPYIILPLLVIVGSGVWWFRGWMSLERLAGLKEQVAAVKEQVAAVEQQLKLAAAASGASERAKDELDKQFQAYKAEVASTGRNASPAKVEAAIVKVASGNTDVKSSLSAAIRDLEFAQYGALKNIDPETLKKLQDVGKALPLSTLKKLQDVDKGFH